MTSVAVLKNDDQLSVRHCKSNWESQTFWGRSAAVIGVSHHVEVITACIEALAEAGITEEDVTAVAVTLWTWIGPEHCQLVC